MPDLLSSLESIICISFIYVALYFSKSMSLPSFFPPTNCYYHIFIVFPPKLSSQLGILYVLPSPQSSLSSSSLTWLLSRPATQLTFGIFLYCYTRLVLLLPGSHLFFGSVQFLPRRKFLFFFNAWESRYLAAPWVPMARLFWHQILYHPCLPHPTTFSSSHLIPALRCLGGSESWASWPFCQADGLS